MTVSYITTASNSAAGPTTTVTVTTGMTVQVGDLIVVMCRHHGSASSISVSDANNVVPTYTEGNAYRSHSNADLNSRTFYGVATSTAALNVTMTTGASRANLKCIVTQARSTKPAGWTLGANPPRGREHASTTSTEAAVCGRTSGIYVIFHASNGTATFTPGHTLTEAHDSTDQVCYRILEQAGFTNGYAQASTSMDSLSHAMFFSDDTEPTTGVRLMNASRWQLLAGGTSHSMSETFIAPTDSVLIFKVFADDLQVISGVTYNTASFTELFQDDLSGAGVGKGLAVFMSVTGADGSAYTPSFSTDASWAGGIVQMEAWAGVETSSVAAAHRTIYSGGDGGGGTGVDLTVVDSQAGDIVWSACMSYISDTQLAPDAFPVVVEISHPSVSSSNIASQYQVALGASEVVTFTGDDFCTNVAFALVAAAGAPANEPARTPPLSVVHGGRSFRR